MTFIVRLEQVLYDLHGRFFTLRKQTEQLYSRNWPSWGTLWTLSFSPPPSPPPPPPPHPPPPPPPPDHNHTHPEIRMDATLGETDGLVWRTKVQVHHTLMAQSQVNLRLLHKYWNDKVLRCSIRDGTEAKSIYHKKSLLYRQLYTSRW